MSSKHRDNHKRLHSVNATIRSNKNGAQDSDLTRLSFGEAVHIPDRLGGQLRQGAAAKPPTLVLALAPQVRRPRNRRIRHDQAVHLRARVGGWGVG